MKKERKSINKFKIILILAILIICTEIVMPTIETISLVTIVNAAEAEELTTSDGNFKYKQLSDRTYEITKYIGNGTIAEIPQRINGNSVTSIGDKTFYGCNTLTNVTIPNEVKSIGEYVFSGCSKLKSITIPSSVNSIRYSTLAGCKTKYRIDGVNVGHQTDSAWCWAYASLKTVETYFMKKNNSTNNNLWNFSEAHLAYSGYKPFGGWWDLSDNKTDGRIVWERGGSFQNLLFYSGLIKKPDDSYKILGPVKESNIENKQYEFDQNTIQTFKETDKPVKILKAIEYQHINKTYTRKGSYVDVKYTNDNNEELSKEEVEEYRKKIKSHIVNSSGLYAKTHQYNEPTNFWNREQSSLFICDNQSSINHAICIIGWDDNYSRDNFNEENRPYNDGAWIAVNSYGTEYGENGFLYISYDDALVEKNIAGILEAEEYAAKPRVDVSYKPDATNRNVIVYLSSPERISSEGWNAEYKGTHKIGNEIIYTTETTLEKTYYTNAKETITVKDESGAESKVEIDVNQISTPELKYKITYYLNGGKNSGNKTSYDSQTETFKLNEPIKEGYTFIGWTGTGLTEATKDVTISKGSTGDREYTAQWKANTYTVRFNKNGGLGAMEDQTMTYGTKTELRANSFTREGYTFAGWDTEADGTGTSYTDKKEVALMTSENGATVTLYAQWKGNNYTVKFNANGGTGEMADQAMTYGTKTELRANSFTREGYTFTGWNTKADGTGTSYTDRKEVAVMTSESDATVTLYAQWIKNPENVVKGDINEDRQINIIDLLLLKRHILSGTKESWKLTGNKFRAADLNGDETVNITDLLLIKRKIIRK